jgi:hypothetical protein
MLAEVIGSASGNSGVCFRGRVSRSISGNLQNITEMLMKCQFLRRVKIDSGLAIRELANVKTNG